MTMIQRNKDTILFLMHYILYLLPGSLFFSLMGVIFYAEFKSIAKLQLKGVSHMHDIT